MRSVIALEAYDAIGRRRERDLGDRPINTAARLRDGTEFDGLDGLRRYLGTTRRDALCPAILQEASRVSLGRGTQLSDDPLLEEMELALRTRIIASRLSSKPSLAAGSSGRFVAATPPLQSRVTDAEVECITT